MKRVHRKTSRTPEEQGRLKAVRDKFQAERPSLDDLVESGDYTEPVKHGVTLDVTAIEEVARLAAIQAPLLARAAGFVKPGGRLAINGRPVMSTA